MEKTLWKKEQKKEQLTYVLTVLGDERYFTERPDLVKQKQGVRAFVFKQPDYVKDEKERLELWINDNRDDFIEYYIVVSNMFLNIPKKPPLSVGGIVEVPFNSVLAHGEGSFMQAKMGICTDDGVGSFPYGRLCIVCNTDKVDTVKIGVMKKWQEDITDEERPTRKKIQEKVAMYFIDKNS